MDFQIPEPVCKFLVDKLTFPDNKNGLVLGTVSGNENVVKELKKRGYRVVVPKDFFILEPGWYDGAIVNPPFISTKMGYDILYSAMKQTTKIVALMPWSTILNSEKRTNHILRWGLTEIIHLPKNILGSKVQVCILVMDFGYSDEIEISFY